MTNNYAAVLPISQPDGSTEEGIIAEVKGMLDDTCRYAHQKLIEAPMHEHCPYDRTYVCYQGLDGKERWEAVGCRDCGHNEYQASEIVRWLKHLGVISLPSEKVKE